MQETLQNWYSKELEIMSLIKKIFWQIWNERPHRCEVCGYPIRQPIAHVFSHIYSKQSHPALKYNKDNIQLWCSTLVRTDGQVGCHEAHHTMPHLFQERTERYGWEKPKIEVEV